jgi:cytochrome c551/c552
MWARLTGMIAALSLALAPASAQAQPGYGRSISGKTHVERAVGKCVASLLIGSLVGAAVGAAAGNTKRGALIGAGAGAVVCALLIGAARNRDRELRAAQLEALNSGTLQTVGWSTQEGQSARAIVQPAAPGSVLVSQAGSLQCRQDDMCRVGDSWYPKADILAGRADPKAPRLVKASFTDARELVCRRSHMSLSVDDNVATGGDDVACLVGDTWVMSDQLKKHKIKEGHITA